MQRALKRTRGFIFISPCCLSRIFMTGACSWLLQAQRDENSSLREKLEMMQYLLPTAASPLRKSFSFLEQTKGWSPRRAAAAAPSSPRDQRPSLPSPTKAAIPSIDKSRLSGVRRGRRAANDGAAAYSSPRQEGSMESHLAKALSVGHSVAPEPFSRRASSQRAEGTPAAGGSTANGPALFSASDLQKLLKGVGAGGGLRS